MVLIIINLKEKVDGGTPLDEIDLDFLQKVMSDAQNVMPIIDKHPEYQPLAMKILALYKEITEKALENEKDL